MSTARRKDLIMLAIGLLVIVVDQLTKRWIVSYFTAAPRDPVQLVGSVLELQYLQNTGVAFSMFEGQTVKFLFIAIAIAVISFLYWRTRNDASLLLKASFGLVLGGAIGNLIDRFTHQYVVDFIHFQIPGVFNFAVFNIADSAICVGVVMLAIVFWRQGMLRDPAGSGAEPPGHVATAPDVPSPSSASGAPTPSAELPRRITSER
jgi:signal peptidase II